MTPNWRYVVLLVGMLWPTPALAGGVVWVYAQSKEGGNTTCPITNHASNNGGYTTLDCTSSQAGQYVVYRISIPPGAGTTFKAQVYYYTPDTGASKICAWTMGVLAQTMFCVSGTNAGVLCEPGSSTCTGGGTCTGGTTESLTSIFTNSVTATSNTQTHVDLREYHTPVTAANEVERVNGTPGSETTTACAAGECGDHEGKLHIKLYDGTSNASYCNMSAIRLEFP